MLCVRAPVRSYSRISSVSISVYAVTVLQVVYGQRANAFFSASRDRRVAMLVSGSSEAQRLFTGHDMVVTGLDINTGSLSQTMEYFACFTRKLLCL